MRPPKYFRAPVETSIVGACLLGLVLLLSACASQQAGISAAEATPSAVASPTITATVTPFVVPPTATVYLPPPPTPNATAIAEGCGPGPFRGSMNIDGMIPLPDHSFVEIVSGITGAEQEIPICTASSTRASISQFMNTALPAAGWTPYDPAKYSEGCRPGEVFQWVKGIYAITIDFDSALVPLPPPSWGLIYCADIQPA